MKRILFVDDEPKVLGGLRRMLRSLRREWEMVFVENGTEALACLDSSPFDVVVTDMRMPLMDGAQLLNKVVAQHPSVVRMILSGQCERNAVLKCVCPAHQFLTKPCDPETLKSTIARACQLRDRLPCVQTQEAVSCIQSLPSHPASYVKLNEELQSATASIQHVSEIVSRDPAMAAKVLQLVSSGFFGTPQSVYDISHAVRLLGLETIRDLVEHTDAFMPLEQSDLCGNFLDCFIEHCLLVAEAAKRIAKSETDDSVLINSAYLAGMLHDIAIYVFTKDSLESYIKAVELAYLEKTILTEIEECVFKSRRDIAGAYLMGLWGLPDSIVDSIAYHLSPSKSSDCSFGPLAAVHVAKAVMSDRIADTVGTLSPIDMDFLEKINCVDRLDQWREICLSTKSEGVLS